MSDLRSVIGTIGAVASGIAIGLCSSVLLHSNDHEEPARISSVATCFEHKVVAITSVDYHSVIMTLDDGSVVAADSPTVAVNGTWYTNKEGKHCSP